MNHVDDIKSYFINPFVNDKLPIGLSNTQLRSQPTKVNDFGCLQAVILRTGNVTINDNFCILYFKIVAEIMAKIGGGLAHSW